MARAVNPNQQPMTQAALEAAVNIYVEERHASLAGPARTGNTSPEGQVVLSALMRGRQVEDATVELLRGSGRALSASGQALRFPKRRMLGDGWRKRADSSYILAPQVPMHIPPTMAEEAAENDMQCAAAARSDDGTTVVPRSSPAQRQ